MFRFPLSAPDRGQVVDAKGQMVVLVYGTSKNDEQARALHIANALNNPFAAAEAEARKQAGLCMARGDEKANEFWIRLAGSLRRAQEKAGL